MGWMHAWLAALVVGLPLLLLGPSVAAAAVPMVTVVPARGPVGTTVMIRGQGWPAGRSVTVSLGKSEQRLDLWVEWIKGWVDYSGALTLSGAIPSQYTSLNGSFITVTPGDYSLLIATGPGADGAAMSVGASLTVTTALEPVAPVIAARFRDYYYAHDGGRLLGNPLTEVRFETGRRAQYFEKGRIEDHAGEAGAEGDWRFMYGRLAADLVAAGATLPVGGDSSSVTYAALKELTAPERRSAPPEGWTGVDAPGEGDAVFVPVDAGLQPAPGHYVPARFWSYINQAALFPAGWVHDIGLPLTPAMPATVVKVIEGARQERAITLQLFERTVLTDDPANPAGFQIERANIGADYLKIAGGVAIPGDVVLHPAFTWIDPTATDEGLPTGMAAPAWQWQSYYNQTVNMGDQIVWLRRELETEGWMVQPGPVAGYALGELVAAKGQRMQVISWWLGTRPTLPPERPELGTRMRVLVGTRS